jgi:hypothetical protein
MSLIQGIFNAFSFLALIQIRFFEIFCEGFQILGADPTVANKHQKRRSTNMLKSILWMYALCLWVLQNFLCPA